MDTMTKAKTQQIQASKTTLYASDVAIELFMIGRVINMMEQMFREVAN